MTTDTKKLAEFADTEIIKRYFKARGWKRHSLGHLIEPHIFRGGDPKILTDFPAFKEHVLEVMEREKYFLVVYHSFNEVHWSKGVGQSVKEIIKDNNILHAAVIAATRYFEGKK